MALLDDIRDDIRRIATDTNEFAVACTLSSLPSENQVTIETSCLATIHHLGMTPEGTPVSTKNAHVSFNEQALIDAGYPVRNQSGDVSMRKHTVVFKDSTGEDRTFIIAEAMPSRTLGHIVCILKTAQS